MPAITYDNGTWGRVTHVDGIPRPVEGATRRERSEPVKVTVSHDGYDDQELTVVFERAVPAIDPRWKALVDDGTITDETLADMPEPDDAKLERLRAEASRAEDARYLAEQKRRLRSHNHRNRNVDDSWHEFNTRPILKVGPVDTAKRLRPTRPH